MRLHRKDAHIPCALNLSVPKKVAHLPGQIGYNFKNVSTLVVEKTGLMRRTLVGVLLTLGMGRVHSADDTGHAFELFASEPADLVFTGWGPDFDGIGFLKVLRRHPQTPNPFVPIIMISANTEPRHIYEARDSGINEYIAKPYSATRVYAHLVSLVKNHRLFVFSAKYFGPDRRWKKGRADFFGHDRRRTLGRAEPEHCAA